MYHAGMAEGGSIWQLKIKQGRKERDFSHTPPSMTAGHEKCCATFTNGNQIPDGIAHRFRRGWAHGFAALGGQS